ncbi:MAG: SDR family oxidoreductase [Pseudomonadota bacterium]|nr:SDR family oxidoreductase [Pseudomonadota bacterium]
MDRAQSRTAIVTGAGKRVGAVVARALLGDGWQVVAHVHHNEDVVPDGAVKIVADLSHASCAEIIFGAASDLPQVTLLVNNAARFAEDGFARFSTSEFDAHMAVNARAPILLIEAFAKIAAPGSLIVNLLDAKLAAPNSDFLSYTLSKQALAGLTELAARSLAAKGIRVNGIAPALMLLSGAQEIGNFERSHALNPLGVGIVPDDVVRALRYLIEACAVTGEIMTIDGGQRFMQLARDVQFLERR